MTFNVISLFFYDFVAISVIFENFCDFSHSEGDFSELYAPRTDLFCICLVGKLMIG